MMFHAYMRGLKGLGQTPADFSASASAVNPSNPYAGTDALGDPVPMSASDSASIAAPDCTPGTAGCVPHWYCYIPFMATSDCLASFSEGMKENTSAVAGAAAGTAAAAIKGITSGAAEGLAKGFNNADSSNPSTPGLSLTTGLMLAIGGGFLMIALMPKR